MERVYKKMGNIGVGNIVLGTIMIVAGVAAGVLTIIGGARLLKGRRDILF